MKHMGQWKAKSLDITAMVGGTGLIAFGINVFFLPFNIISGGMSGVSILIYRLFGITPDVTLLVSNFPLLLLSLIFLGKHYTFNTIVCAFLLPLFVRAINWIPPYSGEPFLATLFGAVITGAGIGLVFRSGSSTGGTAIIEQIVHDYFKASLGTAVILIDGLVLLSAFVFFDVTTGLYSIISLVVIGKMVDYIQIGGFQAKTCLIISAKSDEISATLTKGFDLGVTEVASRGSYTKITNKLLICTCKPKNIIDVRKTVEKNDRDAFCIVLDTKEVVGDRW